MIELAIDDVMPTDDDVLERIGVPRGAAVSANVTNLMRHATDLIAATARPCGVMQRVTAEEFEAVFQGEGRNAPVTPLDEIVPRASGLALFVATIGEEAGSTIEALFRNGDPALAVMLDAWASEMTNATAEALASLFEAEIGNDARVLPYSPGYCGWHVSGQRALFAVVKPVDIRVSLKPSSLMTPIKSVSGVLVAGDAKTHRFRPRWAFCNECIGRDCGPRMASVR